MFQNIKVDIIYFKTATDFEMEFNLSGCCRMRLLTDKAPDKKTLVNQLVRAVSRSRIIIMTGSLFGEDGLISTCSKAISRPLVNVNNKQFGISGEDDIKIISESIPLVSGDGIFGGCIIEQGPQTLILLSENKNIRKNIMQNLIHPYVKEICAGELMENNNAEIPESADVPNVEEETVEIEETVEPTAGEELVEIEETVEENTDEEPEQVEIVPETEGEESEETEEAEPDYRFTNQLIDIEDEDKDLPDVVDPDEDEVKLDIFENYISDTKSELEEYTERDKPKRKLLSGINIPIIILSCILLIVVCVLCYALFIVPNGENVSTGQYLKETFDILFG